MKSPDHPRCLILVRVSSRSQEKGYSLTSQRKDLPGFARKRGWHFTSKDIYDEGVASTGGPREIWAKALRAIKSGRYDNGWMVVREIDRSLRDTSEGLQLLATLRMHNIGIASPDEILDPQKIGDVIIAVVKFFGAEDEKRKRKQEQLRAFREARDQGKDISNAGNPPDGYYWDRQTQSLKKSKRAPLIRLVFDKQNLSYRGMADFMNRKGHKTLRGFDWHERHIKRIRNRLIYTGKMLDSKGQIRDAINVEPIVPWRLFLKNKQNTRARDNMVVGNVTGGKKAKYLMVGLMKCAHCDSTIGSVASKGNTWHGYLCRGKRKGRSFCRSSRSIAMHVVDDLILNHFKKTILDKKIFQREYTDYLLTKSTAENSSGLQRLESELTKLKKEQSNFINALAAVKSDAALSQISKKIDQLGNDIQIKESMILELKKTEDRELLSFREVWREVLNFDSYDLMEKRAIIRSFIPKIVLGNKSLRLFYFHISNPIKLLIKRG